jgi:hypothetical protein
MNLKELERSFYFDIRPKSFALKKMHEVKK